MTFVPPGELGHRDEAQKVLSRLADLSMDFLCVAGTDGFLKFFNQAFIRRMGYTREDLLSTPFLEMVHPEDRIATLEEVAKLANGVPTARFECRSRCKDGTFLLLAWTGTPDSDGKLYAVGRELSEERRMMGALESAQRHAEELAQELEALNYSVSHDLRAPLRAIDGFSRALSEDYGPALDDVGKSYIDRLRKNAQKTASLIDDLLSLSRVNRGELSRSRVDISQIARSVIKRHQENDPNRKVEISVAENIVLPGADERLMSLALEKIIENAWKFTRLQALAKIEIGLNADPDSTSFFVRDNGAGFDMANVHKLFGPFQRLHSEEEFEGNGIGLAIAKRIVARHGGRIQAEGKIGAGARVSIYFTS